MTLLFNVLFAWIAVISAVLLSVIWLLRIIQKQMPKGQDKDSIIKINKSLRKKHIDLGYLFLISSFMHGMLSSFSLFSINYGTITFVLGILILLTFTYKSELGKKWMKYHRELTVLLLIGTVVHLFEVGGFVGIERILDSIKSDSRVEEKIESNESSSEYIDGEYEGIGDGYGPNLKVNVTIKDGLIYEIAIISHNEVGERFYGPAFEIVPQDIIEKQTTNVDVISGATYSSRGIIEAVEDALSKASKK